MTPTPPTGSPGAVEPPALSPHLVPVEGEFDDIPAAFHPPEVRMNRLRNPAVLRVLLGIGIAIAIVAWPSRTNSVLISLGAILLVAISAQILATALRHRPADVPSAVTAVLGIVLAGILLLDPGRAIETVGRVFATVVVLFALADFVRFLRRRRRGGGTLGWPLAKLLAALVLAGSLALYPAQLLVIATSAVAIAWAIIAVLALTQVFTAPEGQEPAIGQHLVWEWLVERPKTADDRQGLYRKILFEGPDLTKRLVSFIALMSFATVIAAMGIINDSTAVVIGAMLVAPLMTPLMGIAISVVMGWPNRLARSAAIALLGIVITIGISYLLTRVAPVTFDPETNAQILSRANPTVIDLIIAAAAGAAGAYGLSRRDVSDALPGVAIAISLVPPLAVVGIAYAEGEWSSGNGALLLFTTNVLAIIVMGGLVFIITGVTPLTQMAANRARVRTATASLVAMTGIVLSALLLNGSEITANAFEAGTIRRVTKEWMEDAERFNLVETRLEGQTVTVVLIGPPSGAPDVEELHASLEEELGHEVTTELRIVLQRTFSTESEPESDD